jgi:hypothetical protein
MMSPGNSSSSSDRGGRGERPLERADRNMLELMQELRVAQIGVQILFAGLITVSFTERFGRIDGVERWTYVVTLLMAAVTTGLLIAPAAVHRMTFGRGVKQETVRLGHHLFQGGLVTLALTLSGAVLLVLDVTLGIAPAVVAALGVCAMLVGLWFVLPLPVRRARIAADRAEAEGAEPDGDGAQGREAESDGDGPDRADQDRTDARAAEAGRTV